MAIEYGIFLSTESSALSLLETVHDLSGLPWSRDRTFLDALGVQVSAHACHRSWREIIKEGFGFGPDMGVGFRLAKELDERAAGYRSMIETVAHLLRRESGPAVLLFNYEIILLQRLGGELTLNRDWQTWQRDGLDLMTLPYGLRSLPSPLLEP